MSNEPTPPPTVPALATIAAISAALSLVEAGLPLIEGFVQSGQMTVEQQAALLAKYNSLKIAADGQFSGPAWQITP